MTENFGGEYELRDAEVAVARIEARHFFLETLYSRRKDVVDDFYNLVNIDTIPSDYLDDPFYNRVLNQFLIGHITNYAYYSVDLEEIGFSNSIRNTPILMFVKYLFKNTDEYERLLHSARRKNRQLKNSPYFSRIVEEDTLKMQFPRWTELQEKEPAQELCNSLRNWGFRWNLKDEWIFDFIIDLLRKFKITVLSSWQSYAEDKDCNEKVLRYYNTWLFSGGTWYLALTDLHFAGEDIQFRIAESLHVPDFVFSYGGINITVTWFPNWEKKKSFAEKARKTLETEIIARQAMGKEIRVGTKSGFENKLKSYIDTVDLLDNQRFYTSSRKRIGEKHFLSLVDYHIPPCMSYRTLAAKYKVDLKTIRRDISAVGEYIGLTPRDITRAGRPKGARTKKIKGLSIREEK